jgi:hypothetical protein
MAVPGYLAGAFRYLATLAVTNVSTIISDLRTELIANGWTEPSTGIFRSPADAFNRYVDLTLSSLSATWVQFKVVDHYGSTIYDGSFYIDAIGTEVRYYTGPDYCYVEALRATPESALLFKPNADPETDNGACPYPFYAWAWRTAAGGVTTNQQYPYYYVRPGSGAAAQLVGCLSQQIMFATNTVYGAGLSRSGAYTFMPSEVVYRVVVGTGADNRWIGRMPQVLNCASTIAAGSQVTVPIDSGVSGTFQRFRGRPDQYSTGLLIRVA